MPNQELQKPDLNRPVFKLFPQQKKNIEDGKCALCGSTNLTMKDEASKKEYSLSGTCQTCQDSVFK